MITETIIKYLFVNRLKNFIKNYWLIGLILFAGIFLRCYQFGSIPVPANQDELSSGYESYSLLKEGTDRWGNKYPAYFLSWGSGQNVLQSYLSMPFVSQMGLNINSVRIVSLLINILTLPLFYFLLKKFSQPEDMKSKIAFVGLAILAFSPWHFMMGRWALESNLLPFFILWGIYALYEGLRTKSKLKIYFSLVPFALALYAYALSFFVIPIFLAIFLLLNFRKISLKHFSIAYIIFLVISLPFLLFLIKNYITKTDFPFEANLPFSIPLLDQTRLEQIQDGNLISIIIANLKLFFNNFFDGFLSNMMSGPLRYISPIPLGIIGFLTIIFHLFKEKFYNRKKDLLFLFAICSSVIFLLPLNMNRANILYLPVIGLFASSLVALTQKYSKVFVPLAVIIFTLLGALFGNQYFNNYAEASAFDFNKGFDSALIETEKIAKAENIGNIFVTDNIRLNYIYYIYTKQLTPTQWREHSVVEGVQVHQIDNYFFAQTAITKSNMDFIFLEKSKSNIPGYCKNPTILKEIDFWMIGKCND